jgi:type VI secretion system protein ImpL
MKALKPVLAILGARWFWTLAGAVLLSLLIWNFGDLLRIGEKQPFGSETARLTAILVIAVLWGLSNLWAQARARRNNDQLVKALVEPAAQSAPGSHEVQELAQRFQAALERLRRSKVGAGRGRRWLYELPWYVMIGPPGSGKTTALVQSGLRFPTGEWRDLRGVGGTRSCDWLFTDEAVLIDTAGRYTTQDSDAAVDRTAWEGFLDLLKKHRPSQPLNGVIVALSAKDLLTEGGAEEESDRIRGRLAEIERRLGLQLPVYLLITKADQLAGFVSFFAQLGEYDREQVWGYTFDYRPGGDSTLDVSALSAGFDDLVARLEQRIPRLLAEENDLARRAEILGFPARVAAFGKSVVRFTDRCFPATTYEEGAWLRGVYLTSGTQSGTPIDRLVAAIAASVGLPASAPLPASGNRSFFLTRLFREVIFNEASLVTRDRKRERRERLIRVGALSGMAAVAAGLILCWLWSYEANRRIQNDVAANLENLRRQMQPFAQTSLSPAEADWRAVIPPLDALANLKARFAEPEPLWLRLGLSQQVAAEGRIAAAYRTALARLLLPRMTLGLEQELRSHLGDPDYVLVGLKVYLMLGGRAPLDPDVLRSLAPDQAPAKRHIAALAEIMPTIDPKPGLDEQLIRSAQDVLERLPLPKRAYQALITAPEVQNLPGSRLTDHAGPNASLVLMRRSGAPLDREVPAIFTYDGFHQVFLKLLDKQARATYDEDWVIDPRGRPKPSGADIERLRSGMLDLYYDDMIATWDAQLRDVTLKPFGGDIALAEQMTQALSGPGSPLKLFLAAVAHETDLTAPPPEQAGAGGVAAKAAGKLGGSLSKVELLFGAPARASPAATEQPGVPVAAHFAAVRQAVVGVGGAPPAIDNAIAALGAMHAKLADAAASPYAPDTPAKLLNAGVPLKQAAEGLPNPVRQVVTGLAERTDAISVQGVRQELDRAWRSEVLPFCQQAIGGRYPFNEGSSVDASLDDLLSLFGASGTIETFVKGPLAPYVDTTRQPWRDVQSIGLSAGALAQLARARLIGKALFPAGTPKAGFTLTPINLDAGSLTVSLDLDGQSLTYAHGPVRPSGFTWPGPAGTNMVRVSFTPAGGGEPSVIEQEEGPWSLIRLLHSGQFESLGQSDLFDVVLTSGGHSASFQLHAGSVANPFDLRLMEGFRCPEGL